MSERREGEVKVEVVRIGGGTVMEREKMQREKERRTGVVGMGGESYREGGECSKDKLGERKRGVTVMGEGWR